MTISRVEINVPDAVSLVVDADSLVVNLSDGRVVSVPLAWFPRLLHGTPVERAHWHLIGGGQGLHWDDLDEDISVEGLLAGRPSAESPSSLKRWLGSREPYSYSIDAHQGLAPNTRLKNRTTDVARTEETGRSVGSKAGKVLANPKGYGSARSITASALTQTKDRKKR